MTDEDDTASKLREALIKLLRKRDWDRIGVKELASFAGIARSTFYLHFQNKDELLDAGFSSLRKFVLAAHRPLTSHRFGFIEPLAEHLFENRELFLALAGTHASGIVRSKFMTLLVGLFDDAIKEDRADHEALSRFLAGGFVELAALQMAKRGNTAASFSATFEHLLKATLGAHHLNHVQVHAN